MNSTKCVITYYSGVAGISLIVVWILWMPLLHVSYFCLDLLLVLKLLLCLDVTNFFESCLQFLVQDSTHQKSTATISDTFADYNVPCTIYLIGPLSLLFVFRFNRVLHCNISSSYKKISVLVLLLSQYFFMVVIRYDTIRGSAHIFFTGFTVLSLLLYHKLSQEQDKDKNFKKNAISVTAFVSMLIFGGLSFLTISIHSNFLWTLHVLIEIFAVLCVGALDLIDVFDACDAY